MSERPRRHRLRPAVAAGLLVVVVGGAGSASTAQEPETPPTADVATTETSTTTTAPQADTPTSTAPSTTASTNPPADPAAQEEAPPESVPDVDVTVPPVPGVPVRPVALRLNAAEIAGALAASEAAVRDATARVDETTARLAELERGLARIDVAHDRAVSAAIEAREAFDARVAAAYVRGNATGLESLTMVQDVVDLRVAQTYVAAAARADHEAIVTHTANRQTLEDGLVRLVDAVVETRSQLRTARSDLSVARRERTLARYRSALLASGADMMIDGFVFPVGEPYSFIDSWGYPRMIGTEYAHGHQGVDIMAPFGTPLYACERGVITRVGTDTLGGIKLWLRGASGTSYYYAHLQAYAPGIASGVVVEAGQVIGTVGDTGNARGGSPHLHFQLHPGGGPPVNPYPLLRSVADLGR